MRYMSSQDSLVEFCTTVIHGCVLIEYQCCHNIRVHSCMSVAGSCDIMKQACKHANIIMFKLCIWCSSIESVNSTWAQLVAGIDFHAFGEFILTQPGWTSNNSAISSEVFDEMTDIGKTMKASIAKQTGAFLLMQVEKSFQNHKSTMLARFHRVPNCVVFEMAYHFLEHTIAIGIVYSTWHLYHIFWCCFGICVQYACGYVRLNEFRTGTQYIVKPGWQMYSVGGSLAEYYYRQTTRQIGFTMELRLDHSVGCDEQLPTLSPFLLACFLCMQTTKRDT